MEKEGLEENPILLKTEEIFKSYSHETFEIVLNYSKFIMYERVDELRKLKVGHYS